MIRVSILASVLLVLTPVAAYAAAVCTVGASGVDFGVFSGSQLTIVGSLSIRCTGGTVNNAEVSLSTGSSGTYASRQMNNGPNNRLSYNLYTDPAFTQIFGDGTGGSSPVTRTSGPQLSIVTIYGKLPAQPEPASGAYSDTIVATLRCPGNSCNTVQTAFSVVANTQADCRISATSLVFGDYNQAQLDAQSQILLTCTPGQPWNIGLNEGTSPGATVATRRMMGHGNFSLMYSLFKDAARALNWGNTVGADTMSGTGTGSLQTIPVYGRLPASQPAVPGGYVDTIIATVTF